MGPRGSKHYIFGDQFYSENAKLLDSMNSSVFMPKNLWYHQFTWSGLNSQEVLNVDLIYFGSSKTNNWSKIHNSLGIWSNSGNIMITYVFYHENRETHGIWALLHFLSKTGCQIYSAWVPGDPVLSYFYIVMSLSEETYTFSEPDCYTIVFSLLSNILISLMWKKRYFVYLIEHFISWVPWVSFHAVTLQKYFMHMIVESISSLF